MFLTSRIGRDFAPGTWLLLLPCIAVNGLIGQWVMSLGWPLYLDMIGTVFLGVTCGPFAGALCGGLTLLLWEFILPGYWCWFPVGIVIGLIAGVSVRIGLFRSWSTTLIAGLLTAVAAVFVAVPIRLLLFPGNTGAGETVISEFLLAMGKEAYISIISTSFLVELADKALICLLAYLIVKLLPTRILDIFPRGDVLRDRPMTESPMTMFGGGVALISLSATFFVTQVISVSRIPNDSAAFEAYSNIPWPWVKDLCVFIADYGFLVALLGAAILLTGAMLDE